MPDSTGALTETERTLVREWFARHWNGPVQCAVCKGTEWTFGTHVLRMPREAPDAYAPFTYVFPYLPVNCNTCGHTLFFGAVTMGLFDGAPPPQPPPPPPSPPQYRPNPLAVFPPNPPYKGSAK